MDTKQACQFGLVEFQLQEYIKAEKVLHNLKSKCGSSFKVILSIILKS